jgi:hypothetical protein
MGKIDRCQVFSGFKTHNFRVSVHILVDPDETAFKAAGITRHFLASCRFEKKIELFC